MNNSKRISLIIAVLVITMVISGCDLFVSNDTQDYYDYTANVPKLITFKSIGWDCNLDGIECQAESKNFGKADGIKISYINFLVYINRTNRPATSKEAEVFFIETYNPVVAKVLYDELANFKPREFEAYSDRLSNTTILRIRYYEVGNNHSEIYSQKIMEGLKWM